MTPRILHLLSLKIKHYFHLASNTRPLVWIALYVCLIPIFALIYYWLPDGQFRIPDNAGTNYGSWLYYSIVTITTLGFGDYTPAHGWAQAVTAVEVMCGLIFLGFFLNAVGSMKSDIDVESEIEKQKRLNEAAQKQRLMQRASATLRALHAFVNHCNAATSGKPSKETIDELLKNAAKTALVLDSLQQNVDLGLWPQLLENSFAFVANFQLLTTQASPSAALTEDGRLSPALQAFITENSRLAAEIETELTKYALPE